MHKDFELLFHSHETRNLDLPINDDASGTAGLAVVNDEDNRLMEDTTETLVGNQDASGLNVGDLQCVQFKWKDEIIESINSIVRTYLLMPSRQIIYHFDESGRTI